MPSTCDSIISFEFANGLLDQVGSADRIDRVNGIVKGVKILGLDSKNPAFVLGVSESDIDASGRMFGDAANKPYSYEFNGVRNAEGMYEGTKIFLNHTAFNVDENGKRTLSSHDTKRDDDLFGWLTNVRAIEGLGLFGDLNYLKSHPFADRFIEIAERNSKAIGLSHEALLEEPRLSGDKVTIPGIKHVQRVALISEQPGTTAGLFESAISPAIRPRKNKVSKKTIRQILESAKPEMKGYQSLSSLIALIDKKVPGKPKVGIVAEMGDEDYGGMMDDIGSSEMDTDDEKEPEDHIREALIKSITDVLDSCDCDTLKKALDALGLSDSISEVVTGTTSGKTAEEDVEPKAEEPPIDKKDDEPEDTDPVNPDKKDDEDVTKENKVVDNSTVIFECMATLKTEGATEYASDANIVKAMTYLGVEERVNYAKTLATKQTTNTEYVPKPRSSASSSVTPTGPVIAAENKIDFAKEGSLASFLIRR